MTATQKVTPVLGMIWAVVFCITLLLDSISPFRSWLLSAWTVEFRPTRNQDIEAYSVDATGGFWLLTRHNSKYYQIYRYTNKIEQNWEMHTKQDDFYPRQVSGDELGRPIAWMETGAWHGMDGKWVWVAYPNGSEIPYARNKVVVSGSQSWFVGKDSRLVQMNVLTNEWSEISLPEEPGQIQSIRRSSNGDLLVLVWHKPQFRVYLLSPKNQWREQAYSVFIGGKTDEIVDIFMDGKNTLWVLLRTGAKDEWLVEKIVPSGEFFLTRLPALEDFDRYDQLIVDTQERVWLSGGWPSFITVFQPTWMGNAVRLERYTETNSNYYRCYDCLPVMAADGKIWSFGRGMSSLDANHEIPTPMPFPDWVSSITIGLFRTLLMIPAWLGPLLFQVWNSSTRKTPKGASS